MPQLVKGAYSEKRPHRRRRLLAAPAARRGGRRQPLQLPGHGAAVVLPDRDRAATPWCSSPARRTRAPRCGMAALMQEAACPTACSTSCTATRRPSTRSSTTTTSRRSPSSGPRRSRATSTSAAPPPASACRPWAGPKPHMLVLPDADPTNLVADAAVKRRLRLAGERCMADSVVVAVDSVADALVAKVRERMATLRTGDGRRACDMGPLITHPRAPRQRSRATSTWPSPTVPRRRRRRGVEVDGRAPTASGSRLPGRDRCRRPRRSTRPTRSSDRALSVVRVGGYEEGSRSSTPRPTATAPAIFTHDGGAARSLPARGRGRWSGSTCRFPVPVAYHFHRGWKASLFGDTKAYGTHGVDFYTREKTVTSRWLDPQPRRGRPGLPPQLLTAAPDRDSRAAWHGVARVGP